MTGLVPAIHVLLNAKKKDVDARHKAGHDDGQFGVTPQMLKRSSDNRLNGAQVIVDYLIREKVPYAFGLCGHGNICTSARRRSRRSRPGTRPWQASWPMSITGSAANRPRPSLRAARGRPICRSR